MQIFCFTFGTDSPLAKYYVAISAESEISARRQMVRMFSGHWSSCYKLTEFQSQIARYGYEPLAYVNYDATLRLGTNLTPFQD